MGPSAINLVSFLLHTSHFFQHIPLYTSAFQYFPLRPSSSLFIPLRPSYLSMPTLYLSSNMTLSSIFICTSSSNTSLFIPLCLSYLFWHLSSNTSVLSLPACPTLYPIRLSLYTYVSHPTLPSLSLFVPLNSPGTCFPLISYLM